MDARSMRLAAGRKLPTSLEICIRPPRHETNTPEIPITATWCLLFEMFSTQVRERTMASGRKIFNNFLRPSPSSTTSIGLKYLPSSPIQKRCLHRFVAPQPSKLSPRRPFSSSRPRSSEKRQPGDDPSFTSILDNPPDLVRTGKRHGPGLIILGTSSTYLTLWANPYLLFAKLTR